MVMQPLVQLEGFSSGESRADLELREPRAWVAFVLLLLDGRESRCM